MKAYSIKIYQPEFKSAWNTFVTHSKNATFLFQRDFMDYHHHCFDDYSLMIFKKGKLVGLLPANRVEDELHSHQGLTYGGLLLSQDVKFETVVHSFEVLLKFLHEHHITALYIKEIPAIYHELPTGEVHYLNFILNAQLLRRDTLSVIDNQQRLKFSRNRLEGIRRGQANNLKIVNDDDFKAFWNSILKINLNEKHNANPVHSLEEILYLKEKFPGNIKQFNVYQGSEIVAGATIFETQNVAHCQYISGNNNKNSLGSLDVLHDYLINEEYDEKRYFDFGTSNENNGKSINEGLQFWKEGFGARTMTQDFYRIDTEKHIELHTILK